MKKILTIIFALALFASLFICVNAFAEEYNPWNVCFEVNFGGDIYRYDLSQSMQPCRNEAEERGFYLGGNAKRAFAVKLLGYGLPERAVYNYILPDFDKVLKHYDYVKKDRADSSVTFNQNGFSYREGQDGVEINAAELFDAALRSHGRTVRISLPLIISKATTVNELKRNTVLRGTFTTSFAASGANRCHNIAQAVKSINGTTVGVGETFSFNRAVGERTEANGYKMGKVILDGVYTDGVGGGVCQVSTTLYNALLLSGFVPKAVQHSLVSSYVKAGFDAMVSYGSADLTFVNDTENPIYIAARVADKKVTFTIYGQPNPFEIVRENAEIRDKFTTKYVVDAEKYPDLIYTDQTKVIVSGSDGVKTKSYLKYYRDGKLVETKQIRSNSYTRVDAVIARGYLERDAN